MVFDVRYNGSEKRLRPLGLYPRNVPESIISRTAARVPASARQSRTRHGERTNTAWAPDEWEEHREAHFNPRDRACRRARSGSVGSRRLGRSRHHECGGSGHRDGDLRADSDRRAHVRRRSKSPARAARDPPPRRRFVHARLQGRGGPHQSRQGRARSPQPGRSRQRRPSEPLRGSRRDREGGILHHPRLGLGRRRACASRRGRLGGHHSREPGRSHDPADRRGPAGGSAAESSRRNESRNPFRPARSMRSPGDPDHCTSLPSGPAPTPPVSAGGSRQRSDPCHGDSRSGRAGSSVAAPSGHSHALQAQGETSWTSCAPPSSSVSRRCFPHAARARVR